MPRQSGGLDKTRHKTNAKNSNVPATADELLSEIGKGIANPIFVRGMLPLNSSVIF